MERFSAQKMAWEIYEIAGKKKLKEGKENWMKTEKKSEAKRQTWIILCKEKKLEYDGNKTDKYNRILAWVWADDVLVQEELAKKGYVEKFYDYGDYKYEGLMRDSINDIYDIFENDTLELDKRAEKWNGLSKKERQDITFKLLKFYKYWQKIDEAVER